MRRLGLLLVAVACSVSSERKSFDAPGPENFRYVSDVLHRSCGSLDCHGQIGRSLRLYGRFGLRLAPSDTPATGEPARKDESTLEEHEANYASVLALEPEIMDAVFRDAGRDPERLTLVRKARHRESHKGGQALDTDGLACIVSWLQGAVDVKLCFDAGKLKDAPWPVSPNTGGSGGAPAGGSGGTTFGGSGGTPSGGSGGTTFGGGGTGATGGPATGGTTASGGIGGTAGGGCGASTGVDCPIDYWPADHDANCLPPKPTPSDHSAYVGNECLSCHKAGGSAVAFYVGGVIWEWGGKKGASKIEVGLRDGATFIYTCTDPKGFYSVPAAGAPTLDWLKVETRMRSNIGEKIMPSDKEHKPTCNDSKCHGALDHQLWAP